MPENERTMMFRVRGPEPFNAREVMVQVHAALVEKGHNPIDQLVGYLLSGDPAYITSHREARSLIRRLERDELLAELVASYIEQYGEKSK